MQISVYTPNVEMVREVVRITRDNRPVGRRRCRYCRRRHRRRRRRRHRGIGWRDVAPPPETRIFGAKFLHETIVKLNLEAVLEVYRRYTILIVTGCESLWPEYVPLGNAVLAGLGAVISQHVLVDGLRSREGRTHLFVQRAHHCGLAPYEGMREGGIFAGVVAFGLDGTAVARTMTFAAGYPKSVPAPSAPRGRGHGGYDTGYQNVFNCRSANNFSYREFIVLCRNTTKRMSLFRFFFFFFLLFLFFRFIYVHFFSLFLVSVYRAFAIDRTRIGHEISELDSVDSPRTTGRHFRRDTRRSMCFAMRHFFFL